MSRYHFLTEVAEEATTMGRSLLANDIHESHVYRPREGETSTEDSTIRFHCYSSVRIGDVNTRTRSPLDKL